MIGVIIARFQTPYLHEGHKAIIEAVKANHGKAVVVLGVSPVLGSLRNPLDFITREKMIKKEFADAVVLPLSDHPSDAKWSANLDTLLSNTFPGESFLLYGGRGSFIRHYTGKNKVEELPEKENHNATAIRASLKERVIDSVEFRTGIIYAYQNTYPKVYPTVDIAVFKNHKTEILLGMKDIDKKWRLPGGFTDPTDEGFEAAALRELKEECGELETTNLKYEGSFRVEDWRYRGERDKIITTLFSSDYVSGNVKASDDLSDVAWIPMKEVPSMLGSNVLADDHTRLFETLIQNYLP